MKRSFLLLLVLPAFITLQAQLREHWSAQTGEVQWLRTTAAGALVACSSTGLHGIDAGNGNVAWSVADLANAPESGYEEIARTPFITVIPQGRPQELFVIEPFSGKVVFDSKSASIENIASRYILPENNALVVVGQKADKTATMACVDMSTGKVRWTKDDAFSKLTACNSAGKDAILVGTLFYAYKLDANTGEELWKKSPDPQMEKLSALTALLDKGGANLGFSDVYGVFITTEHAKDLCFMGMQTVQKKETTDSNGKTTVSTVYNTFVNAFNISDGSYAWTEPLNLAQELGTLVPMERGLLVGSGNSNAVYLLDNKTGEGLWGKKGKGIKVKGSLTGAVPMGDRTLLTSGGKDGAVMLVDAAGTDLWKKPVKVSGQVQNVTLLEDAIMVASEEEVDVIDLATGESKLGKALKGGAGLVAIGNDRTYVFNTKDDLLYAMPNNGGPMTAIGNTPLEFEGKEDPTRLEYTDDGIVVSSDQNIALIGKDGVVKYKKYFPAGRESGLTRALKYASAVRAAYYTAVFGYTSAAFGAASQSIQVHDAESAAAKQVTGEVSDVFGEAANQGVGATQRFLQEANKRLKATASTNDVHFMMTDAGKREYQLVALKKSDGSVIGTIPLGKEKEPRYEVDSFDNTVYLVEGDAVKSFKP